MRSTRGITITFIKHAWYCSLILLERWHLLYKARDCVVPENNHTPQWKVFSTTPPVLPPLPWNFRSRGYFGTPLPSEISNFLKGCFYSPTPCFIRKGFSLKHRCKCQVKPTTYLTSIESHLIVYNIRAIP